MRVAAVASWLFATVAIASPVVVDDTGSTNRALRNPPVFPNTTVADSTRTLATRGLRNPPRFPNTTVSDSAGTLATRGLRNSPGFPNATSVTDSASALSNRAPGDVQCNRTCPRAGKTYLNNCDKAAAKLENKSFAVGVIGTPDSVEHGNCRVRITAAMNTECRNGGASIQQHYKAIRALGCRCGHYKWQKNEKCATVVERIPN
ncbi:uncharacterized protein B0H64DRAFT_466079 [Chaetomium fimeti]|uniref:Uncharacterized protein n=1 Tax=Chaetomium fimeti TaxID=1854472 RepID=A0AAE0LQD0_9PEZI|nr:hypothetical protein B0H64DRAFT_466079 [Chaetomium fimeti]